MSVEKLGGAAASDGGWWYAPAPSGACGRKPGGIEPSECRSSFGPRGIAIGPETAAPCICACSLRACTELRTGQWASARAVAVATGLATALFLDRPRCCNCACI